MLSFIKKETTVVVPNQTKYKLFGFKEAGYNSNVIDKANLLLIIAKFSIIKAKFYQINNVYGIYQSEIKFRKLLQDK